LESVGYYIVAFQFSLVIKLTLTSFHQAFTPWLYEKLSNLDQAEVKKIKHVKQLYFLSLVFIVATAFTISEQAVIIIAGPDYKHASEILPWLIMAQAIRGLYGLESGFAVYARKNTQLAKVSLLSGGLHILLSLILIQEFGVLGVAYSFCVSALAQWLWTRSFVLKTFGKNYLSLGK
jgi:O-antigen/teichoic acid export membrane protein